MHKRPLTPASVRFVESTPTHPLETGLKAVIELTAYPDGEFRIDTSSRLLHPCHRRPYTQSRSSASRCCA
jgi:hypothetical protein